MLPTMFEMGLYMCLSHYYCKNILKIETRLFERYSTNLMRSIMCSYFSMKGFQMIKNISLDICYENENNQIILKGLHQEMIDYFVLDTLILFYQKYLHIENKIRLDLLLHHSLAIVALGFIDYYKMYPLIVHIMMSEGLSSLSGLKLIMVKQGYKKITKIILNYRIYYLIIMRMLYIWLSCIYHYMEMTSTCEKYKEDKNLFLFYSMMMIIYYFDVQWIKSGYRELNRL